MLVEHIDVDGVYVEAGARYAAYNTTSTSVSQQEGAVRVTAKTESFVFKSSVQPRRVGVMLVGVGGSNGSTLVAGLLANKRKLAWREKTGLKTANLLGSVVANACTAVGAIGTSAADTVYIPFRSLAPFPDPTELHLSGWDISSKNLYQAQLDACALQPELLDQLKSDLEARKPYPAVTYGSWLASTQEERADNLVPIGKATTYRDIVDVLRGHIREFKRANGLTGSGGPAQTLVLWTASTERCCDDALIARHLSTKDKLLAELTSVVNPNSSEYLAPSLLYAVAALEEGCTYLNGAPQNTLTPGLQEYGRSLGCLLAGDDFKTGQTKFKSFLTDMLIGSGLRVRAITSYNHLGNNDGRNLSQERQFKSKEISKTAVIDDIIDKAPLLYSRDQQNKVDPSIDHTVVIKYVPHVGDSKRALDEYISDIFMNGSNTISIYNTCEDTLLAVPIMIDIICFAALLADVEIAQINDAQGPVRAVTRDVVSKLKFKPITNLMPVMSLFFKAPLPRTADRSDVVNAFAAQRAAMEDFVRAIAGLQHLPQLNAGALTM